MTLGMTGRQRASSAVRGGAWPRVTAPGLQGRRTAGRTMRRTTGDGRSTNRAGTGGPMTRQPAYPSFRLQRRFRLIMIIIFSTDLIHLI